VASPEWIKSYYRSHAAIYDQTRWAFLFGRKSIINMIGEQGTPSSILEIGCGTGVNLRRLRKTFPEAKLTGVDLSDSMLRVANSRLKNDGNSVRLVEQVYDSPLPEGGPFDVVFFSYSLTMMNPGWDVALSAAEEDLAPGGHIAVVDFHDTSKRGMKWYMDQFHVRIDGHLHPELNDRFNPVNQAIKPAFGALWRYFTFIGKKKANRDE